MRRVRARRTRPGIATVAAGASLAVVALTVAASLFTVRCGDEPSCLTLEALEEGSGIPEAIHLFDRHGDPLADVAGPRRRALSGPDIPDLVARAYVAVEDRRFWTHGGIDVHGVARAALANVRSGEITEGASTISMQLVRTLWAEQLRDVGPWRRKLIEMRLAPRLVDELGRERVLTLYLNAIYLGDGVYGIEEAARHYFGVPAARLGLAQVATLVGMTRAPERYHPRRAPDRTLRRRDVVLDVLAAESVISAEEAEAAKALPLGVSDEAPAGSSRSYFTAAVTRTLREISPALAGTPGLRVFTTLDTAVQHAGEAALASRLEAIESGVHGTFSGDGEEGEPLQGAAVALDPATGAVRAWIGGRDFGRSEFDRVEQARRQVGSLVKPFLVALALERGAGMLDLVSSDTLSIEVREGTWSPSDHVEDTYLPIREALVRSSNRAAVHLGQWLGSDAVRRVGRRVGIDGPIPAVPATFLGAFESSLLEMTEAYATFGSGGVRAEPHLIERVEGPDGTVLWTYRPPVPERSLDAVTSYVVLDGLRAVVDRGTGRGARAFGYDGPAAGKTGTTDEGRDAWFVGLTPELVAGLWIGFDRPRQITPGASGGSLAATAWGDWMARLQRRGTIKAPEWPMPHGVELVRYDQRTGAAYPRDCLSGSFLTAAVAEGSYRLNGCPNRVLRWLETIWRTLLPPAPQPVVPLRGRGPGR